MAVLALMPFLMSFARLLALLSFAVGVPSSRSTPFTRICVTRALWPLSQPDALNVKVAVAATAAVAGVPAVAGVKNFVGYLAYE